MGAGSDTEHVQVNWLPLTCPQQCVLGGATLVTEPRVCVCVGGFRMSFSGHCLHLVDKRLRDTQRDAAVTKEAESSVLATLCI